MIFALGFISGVLFCIFDVVSREKRLEISHKFSSLLEQKGQIIQTKNILEKVMESENV